jgi:hypothetical protein
MASTTSLFSGKRDWASSLSTTHLLLSVGAMLASEEGRLLAATMTRKEGFWVKMTGHALARFYSYRRCTGAKIVRVGVIGGKHWPMRKAKNKRQRVAHTAEFCVTRSASVVGTCRILVGSKCVGPLGCSPPRPIRTSRILVSASRPIQRKLDHFEHLNVSARLRGPNSERGQMSPELHGAL